MSDAAVASAKLISAIVCTHNRYDVLADALTSLSKQSLPQSEYEIIVVDNSSDLRAQRHFWKRSRQRFPVSVEFQAYPSLSKARNTGLRVATAPLVAFSDDDALASPRWLESLVELFRDERSAGVGGGPVVPIWPDAPPPWLHSWLSGFFTIVDHGETRRELNDQEWLAGTNIAYRRDLLLKLGGFDENLGRRGNRLLSNEELEIARRVHALGFKSYYEPAAVMHHKVHADRISQSWLRRRVAWQAVSDALLPATDADHQPERNWDKIAQYALRMPPEMRGLRGLFVDTDDPNVLQRQCDAISALMALMLHDGRDPEMPPR
jgi:GT2 family glycosyltransferase